jgi:hypothetical protein
MTSGVVELPVLPSSSHSLQSFRDHAENAIRSVAARNFS